MLPNGVAYEVATPIFTDGSYTVNNDTGRNSWKGNIFSEGAADALNGDSYGIMFTIDGTELESELFDFNMNFQVNYYKEINGAKTEIKTYIAPTPYGAAILNSKTAVPTPDMKSTWYYSMDGETWTQYDVYRDTTADPPLGGRYAAFPQAVGEVVYVYVPLSSFWTRDDEYRLNNNTDDSEADHCVNFADLVEIAGKEMRLTNVQFGWNENERNEGAVMKDFYFVSCDHNWIVGSKISDPTHTEYGWQNVHCDKCNIDSIGKIEKTPDHEWEYTTNDYDTHSLSCACGEKQDAVPHNFGETVVVIAPTHLGGGISQQVCTDCGQTKNTETDPLTDAHTWTYTTIGGTQHNKSCACGDSINEDHVWDNGTVTTEPTVEAEGVKTFTCICGATKTEAIEKLPAPAAPAEEKDEGGCGSVIGGGLAMMVILSGAAAVVSKKRRK